MVGLSLGWECEDVSEMDVGEEDGMTTMTRFGETRQESGASRSSDPCIEENSKKVAGFDFIV